MKVGKVGVGLMVLQVGGVNTIAFYATIIILPGRKILFLSFFVPF